MNAVATNDRHFQLTWLDWISVSPFYLAHYAGHLVGGYAALLGFRAPRF